MDFNKLLTAEAPSEDFRRRPAVGFMECRRFTDGARVSEIAKTLSHAASQAMKPGSIDRFAVQLAVLEVAQNVLDHAGDADALGPPCGYVMAQVARKTKRFEVAIVDRGVGVPESLRRNGDYKAVESDLEALGLALKEGVTSRPDTAHNGVMLSSLERAVLDNGGVFVVRSGSALYESGGRGRRLDGLSYYQGTVIAFRVDTQMPFRFERFLELAKPPHAEAA